MTTKNDVLAWVVIGGIVAGGGALLLGFVYGVVTVAKWAWGN